MSIVSNQRIKKSKISSICLGVGGLSFRLNHLLIVHYNFKINLFMLLVMLVDSLNYFIITIIFVLGGNTTKIL